MVLKAITDFVTPQTLIAILLTALLSPLIGPITTKLYVWLRILPSPSISAFMRDAEQPFQAGENIDRYGGIEWEKRFRVYKLTIKNSGRAEAENIKATIRFPGVVETYSKREPTGIDYEVHDPAWIDTVVNGTDGGSHKYGTKNVSIGSLPSRQRIVVDFVVNHRPASSEGLTHMNPKGESTIEYEWTVRGTLLKKKVSLEAGESLSHKYDEFAEYLINDGPQKKPTKW